MKKVLFIFSAVALATMTACGPSAEELAKKEQATKDSIAAVEKARQDSIDAANKELALQDSLAAAAKADSLAAAEAAAKGSKGTKPKTTTPKKDENKGLGGGKAGTTGTPGKLGEGKAGATKGSDGKATEPKLGQGKAGMAK
jgi:hypothetical protein